MIKTLKKAKGYITIEKSASIMLWSKDHGIIHIMAAKATPAYLKTRPTEVYWLDVDTNFGNSRTKNESPKVGHILPNGSELFVCMKNDRVFCNTPKGWEKL